MRGVAEQGLCVSVTGFGGLGDGGENAGENFVGGGASAIAKIGPTRKFEVAENLCADRGVGAGAVAFADGGSNGEAADIEGASLITEERAVTAGAGGVALRVAAECGGAGAGDEDDGCRLGDRGE